MDIKINKEIIKRMRLEGFYPDNMIAAYFSMLALHTANYDLLDEFDDYSSSRRAVIIYYDLVEKELWEESPESVCHFAETEKGALFVEELIQLTMPVVEDTKIEVESTEDWIDEWVDIFPKGVKSGGKLLRSDRKSCLSKMIKFIKDYKYGKDLILRATREYIDERERDGFLYTRCATYFISKQGAGSDLADWCEKLKDDKSVYEKENYLQTENTGLI